MRRPKALLRRQRQGQGAAFVGSAWRLEQVAFSPQQLFDFLHKQFKTPNPYCRDGRYRWKECKVQIAEVLNSSALLSIIEELNSQQSSAPPARVEDAAALAPKPRLGQPP